MKKWAVVLALLVAGCGPTATKPGSASPSAKASASPSPTAPVPAPEERSSVAMAYDSALKVAVLYGGNPGNGQLFTDTWTWDGSSWSKQHPASNPNLRNPGMAYDGARQRIVLFGTPVDLGHVASVPPGETWTWDGQDWKKQATTTSPRARTVPKMTYDLTRHRVILFGGAGRPNEIFSDTWSWDGSNWTQLSPSTPGLVDGPTSEAMTYDPVNDRVLLYEFIGGDSSDRNMWLFDGSVWTKQATGTTALPLDGHSMAYADSLQKVVLFGGEDAGIPPSSRSVRSDLWLWDGSVWSHRTPTPAPQPRVFMGMVYDTQHHQVVVFGGLTSVNGQDLALNDTWAWDGTSWKRQA